MLARENRLLKAEHFRLAMRHGRKVSADHLIIYLKRDEAQPHARFGFIVGKPVAGAVGRNLVKRRMRNIARQLLAEQSAGYSAVIRALPGAAEADWNRLQQEITTAFSKVLQRSSK